MHVVYVVHVVQGQGNSFGLFRCVFADLKTSSRSRIPRQLGLGPSQGRRSNLWFSLPNLPIVRLWFSGPLCYERRQSGPVSSQLVHASIFSMRISLFLDAYPFHRCSCDMQRRRYCGKKRRAFIAFQHFSTKSRLPERSERLQDVFLIVPDTWLRRPPIPLTRAARPGTCQMDCCEVIWSRFVYFTKFT